MFINYIGSLQNILMCNILFFLLSTENIFAEYSSDPVASETTDDFKIDDIAKGTYSFRFKTRNNIEREEKGYLDDEGNLVVDGFYSYTDPDGKRQYMLYHADKDGYRIVKIPRLPAAYASGFDSNAIASILG